MSAVVVVVEASLLVGRTGAEGAWEVPVAVDESEPRQDAPVAQVRPFWQQPPPREAGQENQPVVHTYDVADVVEGGAEVADEDAEEEVAEDVVGAAAEVEVERGAVVEGWTYVTDVPAATPNVYISRSTYTVAFWY